MKIFKRIAAAVCLAAVAFSSAGILPLASADTGNTATISYSYFDGTTRTRQMEKLGRGIVAYQSATGIFVSWRLLGDEASVSDVKDKKAPSFTLYRDGEEIATVTNGTNYIDPYGSLDSKYKVKSTSGTYAEQLSDEVTAWDSGTNYYDTIPISQPPADVVNSKIAPTSATPEPDDSQSEEDTVTTETQYTQNSDGTYTYTFTYSPNDASIGDLDGDGEYEIVLKWMPSNARDNMGGYTSPVYLAAYEFDGTPLWNQYINLGQNVQAGAHHTQFLVYDFDGDGKAEVMCQTAPGSKDGTDAYVTDASSDSTIKSADNTKNYFETNCTSYLLHIGNNITSPEYLTVFNGKTGAAIDTIDFPIARVNASCWGDDFGNRCNRFLADVAYLDGVNPAAVYWRGYYYGKNSSQRTGIAGITFDGQKLNPEYRFDTLNGQPGYQSEFSTFYGQGNHNLTVADVDNDGRDEVISGAMCVEVKSEATTQSGGYKYITPRWCTFRGHGDALHIGNYDPTHDGFEFFTVHEDGGTSENPAYICNAKTGVSSFSGDTFTLDYGHSVIDANTGEILNHNSASGDTGRGVMANIGSGGYYQIQSKAGTFKKTDNGFEESTVGPGSNFRIFWDGDLYDEILDSNISDYDADLGALYTNTVIDGNRNNSTKNNYCLTADIFGDWREEIVTWNKTNEGIKLRIYGTAIPTQYKLPTLMHDPVYRSGVAAEQTAYNQPPHVGFYMSEDVFGEYSEPALAAVEGDLYSQNFDDLDETAAKALWDGNTDYFSLCQYKNSNIMVFDIETTGTAPSGSRGSYLDFSSSTQNILKNYVIEFDASLKTSNSDSSQLAVVLDGYTFNNNNINNGISENYLFKLVGEKYSESWHLYGGNAEKVTDITLPSDLMCHFKIEISDNNAGKISVCNTANNTYIVKDLSFTANTEKSPQKLYYLAGRSYLSRLRIDNINISNLYHVESVKIQLNNADVTNPISLDKSGTAQLSAVIAPSEAVQTVTWASSNPDIAEVDSTGMVTAKAVGTAAITATSTDDSSKTAAVTVNVKPTVTVTSSGSGGSVTTGSGSAEYNGTYDIAFTVDSGYKAIIGDNTYYSSATHTTAALTADTTVTVEFKPLFSIELNGSITKQSVSASEVDADGKLSTGAVSLFETATPVLTATMTNLDSAIKITSYKITVSDNGLINNTFTPAKVDLFDGSKFYMAQIFGDAVTENTTYTVTAEISYTLNGDTKKFTKSDSVTITPAEKSLSQYYYFDSSTNAKVALFIYN